MEYSQNIDNDHSQQNFNKETNVLNFGKFENIDMNQFQPLSDFHTSQNLLNFSMVSGETSYIEEGSVIQFKNLIFKKDENLDNSVISIFGTKLQKQQCQYSDESEDGDPDRPNTFCRSLWEARFSKDVRASRKQIETNRENVLENNALEKEKIDKEIIKTNEVESKQSTKSLEKDRIIETVTIKNIDNECNSTIAMHNNNNIIEDNSNELNTQQKRLSVKERVEELEKNIKEQNGKNSCDSPLKALSPEKKQVECDKDKSVNSMLTRKNEFEFKEVSYPQRPNIPRPKTPLGLHVGMRGSVKHQDNKYDEREYTKNTVSSNTSYIKQQDINDLEGLNHLSFSKKSNFGKYESDLANKPSIFKKSNDLQIETQPIFFDCENDFHSSLSNYSPNLNFHSIIDYNQTPRDDEKTKYLTNRNTHYESLMIYPDHQDDQIINQDYKLISYDDDDAFYSIRGRLTSNGGCYTSKSQRNQSRFYNDMNNTAYYSINDKSQYNSKLVYTTANQSPRSFFIESEFKNLIEKKEEEPGQNEVLTNDKLEEKVGIESQEQGREKILEKIDNDQPAKTSQDVDIKHTEDDKKPYGQNFENDLINHPREIRDIIVPNFNGNLNNGEFGNAGQIHMNSLNEELRNQKNEENPLIECFGKHEQKTPLMDSFPKTEQNPVLTQEKSIILQNNDENQLENSIYDSPRAEFHNDSSAKSKNEQIDNQADISTRSFKTNEQHKELANQLDECNVIESAYNSLGVQRDHPPNYLPSRPIHTNDLNILPLHSQKFQDANEAKPNVNSPDQQINHGQYELETCFVINHHIEQTNIPAFQQEHEPIKTKGILNQTYQGNANNHNTQTAGNYIELDKSLTLLDVTHIQLPNFCNPYFKLDQSLNVSKDNSYQNLSRNYTAEAEKEIEMNLPLKENTPRNMNKSSYLLPNEVDHNALQAIDITNTQVVQGVNQTLLQNTVDLKLSQNEKLKQSFEYKAQDLPERCLSQDFEKDIADTPPKLAKIKSIDQEQEENKQDIIEEYSTELGQFEQKPSLEEPEKFSANFLPLIIAEKHQNLPQQIENDHNQANYPILNQGTVDIMNQVSCLKHLSEKTNEFLTNSSTPIEKAWSSNPIPKTEDNKTMNLVKNPNENISIHANNIPIQINNIDLPENQVQLTNDDCWSGYKFSLNNFNGNLQAQAQNALSNITNMDINNRKNEEIESQDPKYPAILQNHHSVDKIKDQSNNNLDESLKNAILDRSESKIPTKIEGLGLALDDFKVIGIEKGLSDLSETSHIHDLSQVTSSIRNDNPEYNSNEKSSSMIHNKKKNKFMNLIPRLPIPKGVIEEDNYKSSGMKKSCQYKSLGEKKELDRSSKKNNYDSDSDSQRDKNEDIIKHYSSNKKSPQNQKRSFNDWQRSLNESENSSDVIMTICKLKELLKKKSIEGFNLDNLMKALLQDENNGALQSERLLSSRQERNEETISMYDSNNLNTKEVEFFNKFLDISGIQTNQYINDDDFLNSNHKSEVFPIEDKDYFSQTGHAISLSNFSSRNKNITIDEIEKKIENICKIQGNEVNIENFNSQNGGFSCNEPNLHDKDVDIKIENNPEPNQELELENIENKPTFEQNFDSELNQKLPKKMIEIGNIMPEVKEESIEESIFAEKHITQAEFYNKFEGLTSKSPVIRNSLSKLKETEAQIDCINSNEFSLLQRSNALQDHPNISALTKLQEDKNKSKNDYDDTSDKLNASNETANQKVDKTNRSDSIKDQKELLDYSTSNTSRNIQAYEPVMQSSDQVCSSQNNHISSQVTSLESKSLPNLQGKNMVPKLEIPTMMISRLDTNTDNSTERTDSDRKIESETKLSEQKSTYNIDYSRDSNDYLSSLPKAEDAPRDSKMIVDLFFKKYFLEKEEKNKDIGLNNNFSISKPSWKEPVANQIQKMDMLDKDSNNSCLRMDMSSSSSSLTLNFVQKIYSKINLSNDLFESNKSVCTKVETNDKDMANKPDQNPHEEDNNIDQNHHDISNSIENLSLNSIIENKDNDHHNNSYIQQTPETKQTRINDDIIDLSIPHPLQKQKGRFGGSAQKKSGDKRNINDSGSDIISRKSLQLSALKKKKSIAITHTNENLNTTTTTTTIATNTEFLHTPLKKSNKEDELNPSTYYGSIAKNFSQPKPSSNHGLEISNSLPLRNINNMILSASMNPALTEIPTGENRMNGSIDKSCGKIDQNTKIAGLNSDSQDKSVISRRPALVTSIRINKNANSQLKNLHNSNKGLRLSHNNSGSANKTRTPASSISENLLPNQLETLKTTPPMNISQNETPIFKSTNSLIPPMIPYPVSTSQFEVSNNFTKAKSELNNKPNSQKQSDISNLVSKLVTNPVHNISFSSNNTHQQDHHHAKSMDIGANQHLISSTSSNEILHQNAMNPSPNAPTNPTSEQNPTQGTKIRLRLKTNKANIKKYQNKTIVSKEIAINSTIIKPLTKIDENYLRMKGNNSLTGEKSITFDQASPKKVFGYTKKSSVLNRDNEDKRANSDIDLMCINCEQFIKLSLIEEHKQTCQGTQINNLTEKMNVSNSTIKNKVSEPLKYAKIADLNNKLVKILHLFTEKVLSLKNKELTDDGQRILNLAHSATSNNENLEEVQKTLITLNEIYSKFKIRNLNSDEIALLVLLQRLLVIIKEKQEEIELLQYDSLELLKLQAEIKAYEKEAARQKAELEIWKYQADILDEIKKNDARNLKYVKGGLLKDYEVLSQIQSDIDISEVESNYTGAESDFTTGSGLGSIPDLRVSVYSGVTSNSINSMNKSGYRPRIPIDPAKREASKRQFYAEACQLKLGLSPSHPAKDILISELYDECMKLGIKQEDWSVFIKSRFEVKIQHF